MLFRVRDTGQLVTESEFRSLHSTTSFPEVLTLDILSDFGLDPVLYSAQPTHGEFETVIMDGVRQNDEGRWIENWVVRPMFDNDEQKQAFITNRLTAQRESMVVTPLQAKAALMQAGLLESVETFVNNPTTDPLVKLAWNNALEFKRLSPMVTSIAGELNMTDEQLDQLFTTARDIQV